jgi:hypothetical protein
MRFQIDNLKSDGNNKSPKAEIQDSEKTKTAITDNYDDNKALAQGY